MMAIEDNLGFIGEGMRSQARQNAISLGATSKLILEEGENHAFYIYIPEPFIQVFHKTEKICQGKSTIVFVFSGTKQDCQDLKECFAEMPTTEFQKVMMNFVAQRRLINKSRTGKALKKAASMFFHDANFNAEAVEDFLVDRYQVHSLEELSLTQLEDLINQF